MRSFSTDTSVTVGAEEEARVGGSGKASRRLGKQGQYEESPGGHKAVMQGNAGNRKGGMFLSIANLRSH